jgi:hypothetical protein
VRFVHKRLRDLALDTRKADIEAAAEKVTAISQMQVHFGVDGQVGRKCNLPLARRETDRTFKTGRPAGGEELLRIGADTGGARD